MARPRLDDEERRARTVGVRVRAAEAAELRERAQALDGGLPAPFLLRGSRWGPTCAAGRWVSGCGICKAKHD